MSQSIARIKREEDEKIEENDNSENQKVSKNNQYIYKVETNIIDLRADAYWKTTNARLYK